MSATTTLLTDDALAMVGTEAPVRHERIDPSTVRRWARAVCLPQTDWPKGAVVPSTLWLSLAKGMMGPNTAAGRPTSDEDQLYWLPPLRSPHTFNAGDEVEFHGPLRVGDLVTRSERFATLDERTSRTGAPYVLATTESTYLVADQVRVRWRNTTITVPQPSSAGASSTAGRTQTEGPVAGAPQEARVGSRVPPLTRVVGPVEVARFAAANEELALLHIDKDFARDKGLRTCIVPGWLKLSLLATALDRWAGCGQLRHLCVRYVGTDEVGQALTATAVVTDHGRDQLTLRLTTHDAQGHVTTNGEAVVHVG